MYSYKIVGQFRIYNRLSSRYWKGKELVKEWKYFCRPITSKEYLFETMDYDEAVKFCLDNTPQVIHPKRNESRRIPNELLYDIKSLLDSNIPQLLKNNKLQFTDRIQNEKDLNEMLKKLKEIIDRP